MLGFFIGLPIDGNGPLYTFLSVAVAGMTTAVILGVHSCLGLLSHPEQISRITNPSQKEHLDETSSSCPAA
jgi:hypothetical protein